MRPPVAVAIGVPPAAALVSAGTEQPVPIFQSTYVAFGHGSPETMSSCTTASATLCRKSPSPALAKSSASGNLSSVIGFSRLQIEVSRPLHSRLIRCHLKLRVLKVHHERGH
jgi:hypothetical protein